MNSAIRRQGRRNEQGDPGGFLPQMQVNINSVKRKLGDIDPASETIKLATLGLRGVAALVLWEKSNDYKMKEDWAKYEATLNQIAVVQPHFISSGSISPGISRTMSPSSSTITAIAIIGHRRHQISAKGHQR